MIGDQYSTKVAKIESTDGCPIEPESTLKNTYKLTPLVQDFDLPKGVVLDGSLIKNNFEDSNFASSTLSDR